MKFAQESKKLKFFLGGRDLTTNRLQEVLEGAGLPFANARLSWGEDVISKYGEGNPLPSGSRKRQGLAGSIWK